MRPDWQPIETAPKDGTQILAFGSFIKPRDAVDLKYRFVWIVKWSESEQLEETEPGIYRKVKRGAWGIPPCEYFATHWMPLPAPPEVA